MHARMKCTRDVLSLAALRLGLVVCCGFCLVVPGFAVPVELVGYDPSGLVRFATPAEADAKRQELIEYIWSGGLPTSAMPAVTRNVGLPSGLLIDSLGKDPIDSSSVSSVDRLDFTVSVSGYSIESTGYLLKPATPATATRLAVFHTGHQRDLGLDPGNAATVNALLDEGFHVVQLDMAHVRAKQHNGRPESHQARRNDARPGRG